MSPEFDTIWINTKSSIVSIHAEANSVLEGFEEFREQLEKRVNNRHVYFEFAERVFDCEGKLKGIWAALSNERVSKEETAIKNMEESVITCGEIHESLYVNFLAQESLFESSRLEAKHSTEDGYFDSEIEQQLIKYAKSLDEFTTATQRKIKFFRQQAQELAQPSKELAHEVSAGQLSSSVGGQCCGVKPDLDQPSLMKSDVSVNVSELLKNILGGEFSPPDIKADATALSEHRSRLINGVLEEKIDPDNGRRTYARKVRRTHLGLSATEEPSGRASVLYNHYQHCFLEVSVSIHELRPEICDCDEETIAKLKQETVTQLQLLLNETTRVGGPIREKVEQHCADLRYLIGSEEYKIEGELFRKLGIGCELSEGEKHIEISYSVRESNRAIRSLIVNWFVDLADAALDLITEECGLSYLKASLFSLSRSSRAVRSAMQMVGVDHCDIYELHVVEWICEEIHEDYIGTIEIEDFTDRDLCALKAKCKSWESMVEMASVHQKICRFIHIKTALYQLHIQIEKVYKIVSTSIGELLPA